MLINEFTVEGSSRRADLVIVDRKLHAYEIKSNADSLARLPGQVNTYMRHFDKVTIVTACRHTEHVLRSTPESVAVISVDDRGVFKTLRRGKTRLIKDRDALLSHHLLGDLRSALKASGITPLPTKRSEAERHAKKLPIKALRSSVIRALKSRYQKTSSAFLKAVGSGSVEGQHLPLLSPFLSTHTDGLTANQNAIELCLSWASSLPEAPDDWGLARWAAKSQTEPFGPVPERIKRLVNNLTF